MSASGPLFEPQLAPDGHKGLGRAMVGGHGGPNSRQPNDYYPTPADVTRALLRVEAAKMRACGDGAVWEPCGRGGAILREIAAAGFETVGTDIVPDPEHGVERLDVLTAERALARIVVTNPPFALAPDIITHMLGKLKVQYLALLLKSTFWHAEERRIMFRTFPPARIYALTWRPDFLGGGAPTMECSWFVWQRPWGLTTYEGPTIYDVLPREAEDVQGSLL